VYSDNLENLDVGKFLDSYNLYKSTQEGISLYTNNEIATVIIPQWRAWDWMDSLPNFTRPLKNTNASQTLPEDIKEATKHILWIQYYPYAPNK
jgi:hypothetical protein